MPKVKKFFKAIRDVLTGSYKVIYGFVLHSFKSMNRKIKSKFPVWRMKEETSEHVHLAVRVFKWVVLPLSLIYVCTNFYFFRENALGSMLLGLLIFFYSNFLPDLPFIYREKKNSEETEKLQWYKKYALLLFAPLLIWFLFSGMQQSWKTTDTFHNFKSLTIYGTFLFALGFFAFAQFPVDVGNITEILSLPLYGVTGYLTHLKVDKIW